MKFRVKSSLVKYILISFIFFFTSCSVGYQVLDDISDDNCDNIVYEQDRVNCQNRGIQSYDEYKKYYDKKSE